MGWTLHGRGREQEHPARLGFEPVEELEEAVGAVGREVPGSPCAGRGGPRRRRRGPKAGAAKSSGWRSRRLARWLDASARGTASQGIARPGGLHVAVDVDEGLAVVEGGR